MNRQTGQRKRLESPEIDPSAYTDNLVYDKAGIPNHWNKNGLLISGAETDE